MPDNASSPPLRKAAELFPAILLLLLLLHAGAEEAAPWYFLRNFGHDVRRVQGVADGYFATAGTPPPHQAVTVATRRRDAAATPCGPAAVTSGRGGGDSTAGTPSLHPAACVPAWKT